MNQVDTTQAIWDALREIPDPELGIDIVELGLIREVSFADGRVDILYTLTQQGCPMRNQIHQAIMTKASQVKGVKIVHAAITFDTPWTAEQMSDDAKVVFGAAPELKQFVDPARFTQMKLF